MIKQLERENALLKRENRALEDDNYMKCEEIEHLKFNLKECQNELKKLVDKIEDLKQFNKEQEEYLHNKYCTEINGLVEDRNKLLQKSKTLDEALDKACWLLSKDLQKVDLNGSESFVKATTEEWKEWSLEDDD